MIISGKEKPEKVIKDMKDKCKALNDISCKPFYVEFSTGYVEFICSPDASITELIGRADEILYEAKKTRRKIIARTS